MRRCYTELGRPATAPLAQWDDAFHQQDFIVVEELVQGSWKPWSFHAPKNGLVPGDAIEVPTLWDYVTGALDLMVGWFHQVLRLPEVMGVFVISRPRGGVLRLALSAVERPLAFL